MQLASWFMYIQHSHCDYTIFCYQVNLLDAANKKSKKAERECAWWNYKGTFLLVGCYCGGCALLLFRLVNVSEWVSKQDDTTLYPRGTGNWHTYNFMIGWWIMECPYCTTPLDHLFIQAQLNIPLVGLAIIKTTPFNRIDSIYSNKTVYPK